MAVSWLRHNKTLTDFAWGKLSELEDIDVIWLSDNKIETSVAEG